MINNKLRYDINTVLERFNKLNLLTYPNPKLTNFDDLLNYLYDNIKLVIINQQPLIRPDSSGLSCFYNYDLQMTPNYEIRNFHCLLGADYNKNKTYYTQENILFLNSSLTVGIDGENHYNYWKEITSFILQYVTKQSQPIVLSIGGESTHDFAKMCSYRPLLVNSYIDSNIPIEHLPLDHTYIIECGNITLPTHKYKVLIDELQPKILVNELLSHKKIKNINWL